MICLSIYIVFNWAVFFLLIYKSVTGLKSVCPTIQKAKTQSIRVWSKESYWSVSCQPTRWETWWYLNSILRKYRGWASFMSQEWGNGRGKRWLSITDSWVSAGDGERLCLVCWPALMWVQSWGSCKSLINNKYLLPVSPHWRHFPVWGCFCNTQAAHRIPVTISMSICKKLLSWRRWVQRGLEQDGVREAEHFTLLQEGFHLFLKIFKIVTSVSEVCFYLFFEVSKSLEHDHFGPKLLWILCYSILLLMNFPTCFLRIYIITFLSFWN